MAKGGRGRKGGGGGGKTRKYSRDNKGRFAPTGTGATARGGRLLTAKGNKRKTQTMQSAAAPKGTIGKPKGLKPGTIKAKAVAKPAKKSRFTSSELAERKVRADQLKAIPKPTRRAERIGRVARRQDQRTGAVGTGIIGKGKPSSSQLISSLAEGALLLKGDKTGQVAKSMQNTANVLRGRMAITAAGSPLGAYKRTRIKAAGRKGVLAKPKGLKPGVIKANAAAKPAAAPKASTPAARRRGQIAADKALRVSQRINSVTAAASTKTGVKRLNATEVGVRAKAFATRKIGGMSAAAGMNFQQQQSAVIAGLSKPPIYSTQKPNRNKPLRYNALGQDKARLTARLASQTARGKIATAKLKPAKPSPVSRRRLIGRRELVGSRMGAGNAPVAAKGSRISSTIKRPSPPKISSMVVRTRKQSKAAQKFRREGILTRTRKPGPIGLGGIRNNPRIQKQQTGMSQLSLIGKPKNLVRFKRK